MKTNYSNLLLLSTILFTASCSKTDSLTSSSDSSLNNSSSVVERNSLVAWYTFNGDDADHSNYGNNVNFNSATPTAGKNGQPNTAYYFDGHSSYMTVPNSASLNPKHGITMVASFKPTGFYQGKCHANRIFMKGYSDQSAGVYYLGYDDAYYYNYSGCDETVNDTAENIYGVYGNNQFNNVGARDTSSRITKNRWYTVVYTVDTNRVGKLYINGELKSTVSNNNSYFFPNTDDLYIGRMQDFLYPYWFRGVIDEIRIYNRAYDAVAIKDISKQMSH